jgi:hypothetical protein
MILQNKIIPIALVAALVGGTVGAFVTNRSSDTATTPYSTATTARAGSLFDGRVSNDATAATQLASQTGEVADLASYRAGFLDGFDAARNPDGSSRDVALASNVVPSRVVYTSSRGRTRSYASPNTRRVYYDYNQQPARRSFWQKHRDKLTVAMGTGGGALLGALVGGKKGAAIGALAGGGGAAVYTYGIRKRNRRY